MAGKRWTPLQEATMPDSEATALMDQLAEQRPRVYLNNVYQVQVKHMGFGEPFGEVLEMSVKRLDKQVIMDWRDIQLMKNQLFGAESTAIQIFPAESRLVDTANQYYFYVMTQYNFPFGFDKRMVSGREWYMNSRQRPFDEHHKPADLEQQEQQFQDAIARVQGRVYTKK